VVAWRLPLMSETEPSLPGPSAPVTPRLYSPRVLAGYTALAGFPVGAILLGFNDVRRGRRRLGWSLVASAVLLFVVSAIHGSLGLEPGNLPFRHLGLNVFLALGLWKQEADRFCHAPQAGATAARWWPPLLVLLTCLLLYGVALLAFGV